MLRKNNGYMPDVLDCLANLSSDEVFTPPEVANKMLDLLPQELFESTETTFLDPFTKSGVFLREITKRLLKNRIPNYKDISSEIDRIEKEAIQEAVKNKELDLNDAYYSEKAKKIGRDAVENHEKSKEYLMFERTLQKELNRIFSTQVFGIAITELTAQLARRSLYCSKDACSKYSVSSDFVDSDGNIRYKPMKHTWEGDSCIYCGANKNTFDRPDEFEQHAYEFIHTKKVEEIFMGFQWTAIVGNPPYHLTDGGGTGNSATPIYQEFVEKAKMLNPKYLTMIIPARWYSGGKGLDSFRKTMLNDKRIRILYDYENYKDVFPGLGGLAGGACYFLWDRDNKGECKVYNHGENTGFKVRNLNAHDVFIRSNKSLKIVDKINKQSQKKLSEIISFRMPFGIPSTYKEKDKGIPCYFTQKIGLKFVSKEDIVDNNNYLNKWKLLIPKAPIAGQTDFSKPVGFYYDGNIKIAKPGEVCSESWLVAAAFDTKDEILFFKSYLLTKTVRFLLLQTVVSQNITRKNFCFVPDLGKYDREYTDEYLIKLWGISQEEWEVIDSKIKKTNQIVLIRRNNYGR